MASMKVNLHGLFANAAKNTDRKAVTYYSECLEEVFEHLRDVASGNHTFEEFAEHYCIKPNAKKADAA